MTLSRHTIRARIITGRKHCFRESFKIMQCVILLESESFVFNVILFWPELVLCKEINMIWKMVWEIYFWSWNGLHDQINCFGKLFVKHLAQTVVCGLVGPLSLTNLDSVNPFWVPSGNVLLVLGDRQPQKTSELEPKSSQYARFWGSKRDRNNCHAKEWMHSREWSEGNPREWSEWVKHSPVIAKQICEWTKRAFLLCDVAREPQAPKPRKNCSNEKVTQKWLFGLAPKWQIKWLKSD